MEEKILDILEELCDDGIVKENKDINLFETSLMDSLAFAEFLYAVEENFDLILSPSEIKREDLETPNKIIKLLNERIK